jgi:hypothetical protein
VTHSGDQIVDERSSIVMAEENKKNSGATFSFKSLGKGHNFYGSFKTAEITRVLNKG